MTLVKVCGVTSAEDALQAVAAGAGALGFNFWPRSPRYIEPSRAREIAALLPAGVLKVGVFVEESDSEQIVRLAGMDLAQLHGGEASPGQRHWRAWPVTLERLRERMGESSAEAFLIDTPAGEQRGGTGKTFDWRLACGLPGRIVLAGGLGPDNVAEAIRLVRPWGVDACSGLEREPGRKDHAKVAEFIRAAQQAFI